MKSRALVMYHPNGKGTGAALKLELRTAEGEIDGGVLVTLAPQTAVACRTENETIFPKFDWDNPITSKLDILAISQILMVFRGMEESIADGKGLFLRSVDANRVIKFEHRIEPVPGYMLDISEKPIDGEIRRAQFFVRNSEAFAISVVLEQAMLYIAFGVPPFGEVR